MSTSELETQINRFKVNEERLNTFVNVDGFYTTSSGVQVPTLLNVSKRIETSVENVSLAEQAASIEITRQTDLVIAASTSAQQEFLNEDSKINTLAKNTIADWQTAITTITQTEGVPALAVSTANNETQQSINDSVGAKWYAKGEGYPINYRVMLENGDIVRSTVDNNTTDPNVDMTGWVKVNSASQIFDESGLSQQEVNNKRIESVASVSELSSFKPKSDGQIVYLKSYHPNKAVGWGYLKYDQAASDAANNVTSFASNYGGLWRRQLKDAKEVYAVDGGVLFDKTTDNTDAFNRICAMLPQESTLRLSHGTAITGAFKLPEFGCKIIGADLTHSTIKLKTISDYIGWKDYCSFENFRATGAGVYAGESYLFKDTRADKNTRSDCDIFWKNCYFSEAEFITDGFGRGFKFDNCQDYNIRYAWVKADFPPNFVPNGTDNDTLETGFRGFIFNNCRRHYSPAYFLWNVGYNAKNLHGVQITNTWLEGGGRFVVGYMRDAVITGTLGYHRNAPWKYFELTGGENITITGNTFAKMKNNSASSDAFLTSAGAIKGLTITGNVFHGVDQEIVKLSHSGETSQGITIANNTYQFCFSTGAGIFNITSGAVDGLTVRESGIVAPSSTWIPVRRSASLTVTNHKVDVNCSVSPYVHNFARGASLGSSRKQGVYNGTGNTLTQNIVVGYEARMIRVTGSDGTVCVLPHGTATLANGIAIGTAQDFTATGNANKTGVTYFWETD